MLEANVALGDFMIQKLAFAATISVAVVANLTRLLYGLLS